MMGKIDKGVHCMVKGCSNVAVRSISANNLGSMSSKVVLGSSRRVYLCDEHYKEWKKLNRDRIKLERLRF
jgi:single-stranded DNA-specific DHH superfamily exonuclease